MYTRTAFEVKGLSYAVPESKADFHEGDVLQHRGNKIRGVVVRRGILDGEAFVAYILQDGTCHHAGLPWLDTHYMNLGRPEIPVTIVVSPKKED